MKKLILIALVAIAPCFGDLVTVTDTLTRADGGFCGGWLVISWHNQASNRPNGQIGVPVTKGNFSVTLNPGVYRVLYDLQPWGCGPRIDKWVVPVSSGPVNIDCVQNANCGTPVNPPPQGHYYLNTMTHVLNSYPWSLNQYN